jgi:hypothetical protein
LKILNGNGLQLQKTLKTAKTRNKMANSWPRTSIFLPKRPKNGLIFVSVLNQVVPLALLIIAAE